MRLAFISILRRLLGPQFDFLAIICSQIAFFHPRAVSVYFAVFICFLDGIVRIVVFHWFQGWTGHDGSGTQRGAPNSSIFLFNFWSKDPPCYLRILPVLPKVPMMDWGFLLSPSASGEHQGCWAHSKSPFAPLQGGNGRIWRLKFKTAHFGHRFKFDFQR